MEAIDFPDASFDVVLCREGLMLVPDTAKAVAEACRVVLPGGRVVFAVWGPRDHNRGWVCCWHVISRRLGVPFPPPGCPPFSLSDEGSLEALLSACLRDVDIREVETPMHADSFQQWWTVVPSLAGPAPTLAGLASRRDDRGVRGDAQAAFESTRAPMATNCPVSASSGWADASRRRRAGLVNSRGAIRRRKLSVALQQERVVIEVSVHLCGTAVSR